MFSLDLDLVGVTQKMEIVAQKCEILLTALFFLINTGDISCVDFNPGEVDGFYLDISSSGTQNEGKTVYSSIESAEEAMRPSELECPSDNVITTKYRCQVDDQWTDCSRSSCCQSYTFVAGRCVPDDINPCSLNLCEQKCSVYFGRVVCTCFSGYKFNREKHLLASSQPQQSAGSIKACQDINECSENNGDCEQVREIHIELKTFLREFETES